MRQGVLTIIHGPQTGKRFLLQDLTVFEAGRSQGHHVYLRDPSVAFSHFRILRKGEEYSLLDLGSTKGTLLNGERVEKAILSSGDRVQAGSVELEFTLSDQAQPLAAEAPQQKVPALIIIDGKDKGRTFTLAGKERFKVGRATSSDLKLSDVKVSREHCLLETVRDHHIIIDLDSSNGTVVNGERVKKTVLKQGDYIRLGFTVMKYDVV